LSCSAIGRPVVVCIGDTVAVGAGLLTPVPVAMQRAGFNGCGGSASRLAAYLCAISSDRSGFRCKLRVTPTNRNKDLIMRAYGDQKSDNVPVKRSPDENRKLLRDLKETLAGMKPHTTPTLRESVANRIKALEAELKAPVAPRR